MTDALVKEQIQREKRAAAMAQSKRLRELADAVQSGRLDAIPAAGRVVARMFAGMVECLEVVVNRTGRGPGAAQRGWLRELPPEVLAVITIRGVLSSCLKAKERGATIQQLATGLGRRIVREVLIQRAEEVNPVYVERTLAYLKDAGTVAQHHIDRTMDRVIFHVLELDAQEQLRDADLLHMGKHCVQAALAVGLLELHRGRNHKGRTVAYILPDELRDLLVTYHPYLSHTPKVPSVAPPVPWSSAFGGGYHTKEMGRTLVRLGFASRPDTRRQVIHNVESNKRLLKVVNYLQDTAFTLDPASVDTLIRVWESGGHVLDMPARHPLPKPAFPFQDTWLKEAATPEELDTFKAWKRRMADWYTADRRRVSKLYDTATMVRESREIAGRPIWYPMYMDFRQRLYYGGDPNPQGADAARSLVFFHEKKALGPRGVFWLKVHIANCFGQDTGRFEARAAWVDEHWQALSEGAHAPEDSDLYRDHPDSPLLAVAAVRELQRAYDSGDPTTYETGIPVHMDATCSGLQHFSAMLRDPVGAEYTNLRDGGTEEKADIYNRVAELAMQRVLRDAKDSSHQYQLAAQLWLQIGIPRSLAKRPVMTYVYGATLLGVAEHCRTFLEELGWSHEAASSVSMGRYMGRILFDAVETTVPAAASCMRWLRQRCRDHGRDTPLLWKNPMGFLVSLDIREYKDKKVRLRSCGVEQVVLKELGELNNGQRIGNSVSPNFVHSLDAAHLCRTAELMQAQGLSMVAIHDSFGTHPCDVDAMHKCIREAFVQMYEEHDPLQDFLDGIGQDAELPMKGNFDLTQVINAEFFFC